LRALTAIMALMTSQNVGSRIRLRSASARRTYSLRRGGHDLVAEVREAVRKFHPHDIVLNAGGARFLEGDPITMTAEDVIQVCQASPHSQVVAVHMEAINHCLLSRADLAFQLEAARVIDQVAIPGDGDWVQTPAVSIE